MNDKIVWVTGAGSGIGRAIAVAFGREGARVALTGRTAASLEETAKLLPAGRSMIALADVTKADQIAAAHRAVVAAWGEVDVLVNNAGFNLPERHWAQISAENAGRVLDANLRGPVLCSLAVLPAMRKRGGGLLIHIASFAGQQIGIVSGPIYTAAKHGAVAMSATINAEEGIHGIRSVCISPGEVDTPLLAKRPNKLSAEQLAKILKPEDIADCAIFAARMHPRACPMEIVVVPTDNGSYRHAAQALAART